MESPVTNQGQRFSGLSIAGFICSWFFGPIGIILSALAISEVNRNPETLRGKGLAKWGLGLGIFGTLVICYSIFYHLEMTRARELNNYSMEIYNKKYRQ